MFSVMYGEKSPNTYEMIYIEDGVSFYLKKKRLENLETLLMDLILYKLRFNLKMARKEDNIIETLYNAGEPLEGSKRENEHIVRGSHKNVNILLYIEKTAGRFAYSRSFGEEVKIEKYKVNPLVEIFLVNEAKRIKKYEHLYKYNRLIERLVVKYLKFIYQPDLRMEHVVTLDILGYVFICKMQRASHNSNSLNCEILHSGRAYSNIKLSNNKKEIATNEEKGEETRISLSQQTIDSLYDRSKLDKKQKEIDEKLEEYKKFNDVFEQVVNRAVQGKSCTDGLVHLWENFQRIQKSI